jgi:Obg family GTPase CgtA-like protein
VVDGSAPDPAADLATVRAEVAEYDPALADRPSVVVVTKADLLEDTPRLEPEQVTVSAVTGEGIDEFTERLAKLAAATPPEERRPAVILRPGREAFTVRKVGEGRYLVEGRTLERWVRDADLEDPREVIELQGRLRRLGVERRLEAEGARRGDEVVIAGRPFEFIPETN